MARETTAETMTRYIQDTKLVEKSAYDMRLCEANALWQEYQRDPFRAILLAFRFGFAKGQRAMRAHQRRATA